jgi:hypothetical protein
MANGGLVKPRKTDPQSQSTAPGYGLIAGMADGGPVQPKKMADGGMTDEERKAAIAQIPATTSRQYTPEEAATIARQPRDDSTELGRNVSNTLSALPGIAPMLTGVRALAGATPFVSGLIKGLSASAAPLAPYAPVVAGMSVINARSQPEPAAPAAQAWPAAAPVVPPQVTPTDQRLAAGTAATPPTAAAPASAPAPGVIASMAPAADPQSLSNTAEMNRLADSMKAAREGAYADQDRQQAANQERSDKYYGGVNDRNTKFDAEVLRSRADSALRLGTGGRRGMAEGAAAAKVYSDQADALDRGRLAPALTAQTQQGETARTTIRDLGETLRERQRLAAQSATAGAGNKIATERLAMDQATAHLDQASKQRLADAQTRLANAKTPEEKTAAEDLVRAYQGKFSRDFPSKYTVVPGGQQIIDNQLVTQPAGVIDNDTGTFIDRPAAKAAVAPAVGTVKNGFRFKGGDPASQKSWEKA